MSDEDHRHAAFLLHALQFGPHLQPQPGVQIRQRLVQHQQLGLHHQRACQRHPLLLAAGKVGRLAPGKVRQPDCGQPFLDTGSQRRTAQAVQLQPEGDVIEHGQMREQGVGLEDQPDLAPVGRHAGDLAPVECDAPASHRHQPGDGAHRRGLAAAGWPQQGHKLASGDGQAQPVDGDGFTVSEGQPLQHEIGIRHSARTPKDVRRQRRPPWT